LEDSENLPSPEVLAAEISENLQSALEQFNSILEALKETEHSNASTS
jgi:type I restriction enzyme M protein